MSLFAFRLIYNDFISVMLNGQMDKMDDPADTLQIYDVFSLTGCRSFGDPVVQRIVAYMNENFTDPDLNMSAIADRFALSDARLSLDFKERMGMSPSDS